MSNTTQTTAGTRPQLAPPIDATDAASAEHTDIPSYLPDILVRVEGGITTRVDVLPDRNPKSCYVLDWDDVRDSLQAARDAYEQLTGADSRVLGLLLVNDLLAISDHPWRHGYWRVTQAGRDALGRQS